VTLATTACGKTQRVQDCQQWIPARCPRRGNESAGKAEGLSTFGYLEAHSQTIATAGTPEGLVTSNPKLQHSPRAPSILEMLTSGWTLQMGRGVILLSMILSHHLSSRQYEFSSLTQARQ